MNQHYLKFFRMIRDGRYFHVGRGPAYTRAAARVGDVIAFAVPKFPFTSFRLENVLTPYQADVAPTRAVCGEVPYSVDQGIDATAKWLLDLWSDRAA